MPQGRSEPPKIFVYTRLLKQLALYASCPSQPIPECLEDSALSDSFLHWPWHLAEVPALRSYSVLLLLFYFYLSIYFGSTGV
jgi:hypothetical protein